MTQEAVAARAKRLHFIIFNDLAEQHFPLCNTLGIIISTWAVEIYIKQWLFKYCRMHWIFSYSVAFILPCLFQFFITNTLYYPHASLLVPKCWTLRLIFCKGKGTFQPINLTAVIQLIFLTSFIPFQIFLFLSEMYFKTGPSEQGFPHFVVWEKIYLYVLRPPWTYHKATQGSS